MDIKNILIFIVSGLLVIAIFCAVGVMTIWPNPMQDYVPLTWYWHLGYITNTIFVSKGSIVIYTVVLLGLAEDIYFKPKRERKVSTKKQLVATRNGLNNIKKQLRFAQSQVDRSTQRALLLVGVIRLFREKVDADTLAEVEQYVDLDKVIHG